MLKRISCLLTISGGEFFKTRNFQADHIYSLSHVPFNLFDEVVIICRDNSLSDDYLRFITGISKDLRVPLTLSGRIQSKDDAKVLFDLGADRIILNSALWDFPQVIPFLAERYGKQAILGSFDLVKPPNTALVAYNWSTSEPRLTLFPESFSEIKHHLGEILLQDVDNDGRIIGPSIQKLSSFIDALDIDLPIHIGSAGLTSWDHYTSMFALDTVDAVSITNIHHMSIDALQSLRSSCKVNGIPIRQL